MIRPLRVVGLDLSTSSSGIARTHDSTGEPRRSVASRDTSLRPLHEQIDIIEIDVRRACGVPKTGGAPLDHGRPDLVVIEGTFSRPGGSDYPLHALRGCVTQWLHRQRIPYADVKPSTLKVWATGSGSTRSENKVTKDRVCAAIVATYGPFLLINPRDDDACDAVALMTMGLAAYGQALVDVPRTQTRALAVPTWPALDETPVGRRAATAAVPQGTSATGA